MNSSVQDFSVLNFSVQDLSVLNFSVQDPSVLNFSVQDFTVLSYQSKIFQSKTFQSWTFQSQTFQSWALQSKTFQSWTFQSDMWVLPSWNLRWSPKKVFLLGTWNSKTIFDMFYSLLDCCCFSSPLWVCIHLTDTKSNDSFVLLQAWFVAARE